MSYTCAICNRPLTKPKMWHQCLQKPVAELFEGRPPVLKQLFDTLVADLGSWSGVRYSATKNCIVFLGRQTFLVIRPMKLALDLKFRLQEANDGFPVYKVSRWGRHLEHHIRLFEPEDLDGTVRSLLRQSYEEDRASG